MTPIISRNECVCTNIFTGQPAVNVKDMTKQTRNKDCSQYDQQKISQPKVPRIQHFDSPLPNIHATIDR